MNLENAKEQIDLAEVIDSKTTAQIKKVGKSIDVSPCPFCGSNDAFRITPEAKGRVDLYNCLGGCDNSGGSIIDFLMKYDGLTKKEAIKKTIELSGENGYQNIKQENVKKQASKSNKPKRENNDSDQKDFSFLNEKVEKYHKSVSKTNYFNKRGIGAKLIKKYKLGYNEDDKNVVLPVFENGKIVWYTERKIDVTGNSQRYYNPSGFDIKLFNKDIFKSDQKIIFVTEGIFDALSVEEVIGKPAFALNSSSNATKLVKVLDEFEKEIKDKTIIFLKDKDKAGDKVQKKLKDKEVVMFELMEYEDANEYLENGARNALQKELENMICKIKYKNSNSNYMSTFLKHIKAYNVS